MTEQERQERKATPRRVELTERDMTTLKWIGEQYAAAFNQLQRILGSQAGAGAQTPGMLSESATRVWLTRMKALGVIETDRPFKALPAFVWLRPAGLQLAGLDFKYLKPSVVTLYHLYWCNEVRLFLARRRPDDQWVPERQLRSQHAQAGKGQARRSQRPDLPDAHLITEKGPLAIEIELSDKQAARLEGILARRANQFYTTWYFCSKGARSRVEAARAKLSSQLQQRIGIYDLSFLDRE
jgi:hypothetical protein